MGEFVITGYGQAAKAFREALARLGDSLKGAAGQAPRRAAIMICKSLRAGTVTAKKNKGLSVRIGKTEPKWITYKDGKKLPHPLRRYVVTLKDRGRTFDKFAYFDQNPRQQIRGSTGTNYYSVGDKGYPQKRGGRRGLAKRSWGWVMHNIFAKSAADTPWQRRKNDKRNPKDAAKDSMSTSRKGAGMARICNRLEYINEALKVSPQEAIRKATARIIGTLTQRKLKSDGMSSEQIRAEASRITNEFKREFGL